MYRDAIPTLNAWMLTCENICEMARAVGFDACGVTRVHPLEADAQWIDHWIAEGLHGALDYLERNRDKRYNPERLVPGAKTMVVCLLSYEKSGRDYHRTVKSLLYTLEGELRRQYGDDIVSADHQHIFCDSAPLLERRWCVEAGLGFIGRNRQLIHPVLGSKVHPGEIILNVETPSYPSPADTTAASRCADCRRCLDACPTGALRTPVWDARLCVAYTTHNCLVCQNVCSYNNETP